MSSSLPLSTIDPDSPEANTQGDYRCFKDSGQLIDVDSGRTYGGLISIVDGARFFGLRRRFVMRQLADQYPNIFKPKKSRAGWRLFDLQVLEGIRDAILHNEKLFGDYWGTGLAELHDCVKEKYGNGGNK